MNELARLFRLKKTILQDIQDVQKELGMLQAQLLSCESDILQATLKQEKRKPTRTNGWRGLPWAGTL